MSKSPINPHWDKLPDAPAEFFELTQGFGQADLKRAYFRYIKQYKPEKHPQEFQRIRAAFEQLDNQLRYGAEVVSPTFNLQKYSWNPPVQKPVVQDLGKDNEVQPAPHRKSKQPIMVRPLHERLTNESPAKLYEEINQQSEKCPFDYYALAVLSDNPQEKDSQEFVRWILIGLKLFPRDPALYQLLYATIRGPIRSEHIPKLLSTISIVVPDDRFYSLTEALWDRLIRDEPFEVFRILLKKCERNLSDFRIGNKLAFYAHFLKAAMWSKDSEWVSNAFSLLDEHNSELPPGLEYEVEVLFRVREYLQIREEFVEDNPIRKLMDQTIRAYCTKSPFDARNAFLACQIQLATSAAEVLEAFPVAATSPAFIAFIPLWQWINAEFSDNDFHDDSPAIGKASVRQMLIELESKTNRTLLGEQWRWSSWGGYVGRKLFYMTFFLILYLLFTCGFDKDSPARGWAIFASFLCAAVGGLLLDAIFSPILWERWCSRISFASYNEIWRQELLQFLTRTYLPYSELQAYLSEVSDADDNYGYISLVKTFVDIDFGLMLLSDAQKGIV